MPEPEEIESNPTPEPKKKKSSADIVSENAEIQREIKNLRKQQDEAIAAINEKVDSTIARISSPPKKEGPISELPKKEKQNGFNLVGFLRSVDILAPESRE